MKNRITQVINKCGICQTLKYDRHQPKKILLKTETPIKHHHKLTENYRIVLRIRKDFKLERDHEEIWDEEFLTYSDSIHATTKLKTFELFSGRSHIFKKEINFDEKHKYLKYFNEFRMEIYKSKP